MGATQQGINTNNVPNTGLAPLTPATPMQTTTAPQTGGVYQQSAGNLAQAGGALGYTTMPGAIANSMNSYLNPYRTQVIDDAMGRLRDRRDNDLNMVKGNAAQSNAYGGSRHGLVEAELIDRYGRAEDEQLARLLQQGFDTTAGLGAQELGFMQSGAGGLMNLGNTQFNIGQQVAQGQLQAGTMQQQLLQAILGGSAGQYGQYANYPTQQLGTLLSALSGNPLGANQTQSYKPGLFDYLGMGAGVYAAGK